MALARGDGTSSHSGEGNSNLNVEKDMFPDGKDSGLVSATVPSTSAGAPNPNVSTTEVSGSGADEYDMFAEDDDTAKPSAEEHSASIQTSTDAQNIYSDGNIFKIASRNVI